MIGRPGVLWISQTSKIEFYDVQIYNAIWNLIFLKCYSPFNPHVLTLCHKHTLPLYTHFPSCSSTEKLLWIIDQERWGNQCGLPRQHADPFPRVSLCFSICLPLYRCTCFLSAWVRWAKASRSLTLVSICIRGAQAQAAVSLWQHSFFMYNW